MIVVKRENLDGVPAAGSTLHPIARFSAPGASAILGWAEVFERYPPEPVITGLRWDDSDAGAAVLRAAVNEADGDAHVLTWTTADVDRWDVLADLGFQLFQEKVARRWTDHGETLPSISRLHTQPMSVIGRTPFAAPMARAAAAFADRRDREMIGRVGIDRWVATFLADGLDAADEQSWLLATAGEQVIGYVGVNARDAGEGVVAHIAVVPQQRGQHYSDDLLRLARRAARQRGFSSLVSLVDTTNAAMLAALRRADDAEQPWHKWHHRRPR